MSCLSPRLLLTLALGLPCAMDAVAAPVAFHRDGVLGTSLDLAVDASPTAGEAALQAVLAETARLDAVLSTWREDSELSRFNRSSGPQVLSTDLREVLQLCQQWSERTDGIFSCRLGALAARWRQAAHEGVLPPRSELRAMASAAADAVVVLDDPLGVIRPEVVVFDVDGLAKGYIIDRALAAARKAAPAATAIKLDIGGDARYWQAPGKTGLGPVGIADPRRPRDNGLPIATVALADSGIAASGHMTRGYKVGYRQYSHILDPYSGWPMQFAPAATVTAADATTADALATTLSVMPIKRGVALADSLDGVAALILSDTGIAFASQRWPALLDRADAAVTAGQGSEQWVVDYQVPQLQAQRYFAPYLALWVAQPDGTPVRQLLVLGDRSRWLQSLPQWWRQYGRDDLPAIQGIARPTRMPGQYSVGWDGRDDHGRRVAPGNYLLQVEAARQAGGHEFLSLPFDSSTTEAAGLTRSGTAEVGTIVLKPASR